MTQDNRAVAYWEGDTAVFRGSGLSTCEKALAALLMDYEPTGVPGFLEDAFAFGHEHEEPVIVAWLGEHPEWELVTAQEVVEFEVAPGIIIRGHTDGRIKHAETGEERVLEVKTLGADLLKAWQRGKLYDRLPAYGYQAQLYMQATGLDEMHYVVLDKAHYKATGEYVIHEEAINVNSVFLPELTPVLEKLKRAVTAAKANEMPSDSLCGSGLCPVSYLHDGNEGKKDIVAVDGEDGGELAELCKAYREAKTLIDAEEKKLKGLREGIVALMGDNEKVSAGGYRVVMVNQERKGIDKKKLTEDGLLGKYETSYAISYPRVSQEKGVAA